MEIEISKVADTLMSQSGLFQCSIEEAWNTYMHPILTENFDFEEVKVYIDRKVELGRSIIE
ncbi:hypothetical protein [Psychrobacillus phage Perkons]|nr:hypothetical protein [Psychrobacillus phage Perkons]